MSSDGENTAPPVMLPDEYAGAMRGAQSAEHRLDDWFGMAAAALLHLTILLWLVMDWHLAIAPSPPDAVPVRLVMVPPAPEPEPVPQTPARSPPKYRESGKDQQTTAPPSTDQPAPEPTAPPASTPSTDEPAPDRVDTKPGKAAPRAPRKEAAVTHAPKPQMPHPIEIEPGDKDLRGDPYLNKLSAVIAQHWIVPKAATQFGLPLEGVAVYSIIIDPRGNLINVKLLRSSGAPVLDDAGERMLREAAPFPPPPPDFPSIDWPITWVAKLFSEP